MILCVSGSRQHLAFINTRYSVRTVLRECQCYGGISGTARSRMLNWDARTQDAGRRGVGSDTSYIIFQGVSSHLSHSISAIGGCLTNLLRTARYSSRNLESTLKAGTHSFSSFDK